MAYLDYNAFVEFVDEYFADNRSARLVGTARSYDSRYTEIVRFFDGTAPEPRRVAMRYDDDQFAITDPVIEQFTREMERQFRKEGRLYDGPKVMAVRQVRCSGDRPDVCVHPADYGDKCGMFALDLEHPVFGTHRTLRRYYKSTYGHFDFADSPFPPTLGVCGYLLVEEARNRFLLQVTRSGRLASLSNTLGPSAAGSVDYVEGYADLAQLIDDALGREVVEEINLKPGEFTVTPLAFARELYRGEKPQLFCLVQCSLDRATIAGRMAQIPPEMREHARFEFVKLNGDGTLAPAFLDRLNHEARMNYHLIKEMLSWH